METQTFYLYLSEISLLFLRIFPHPIFKISEKNQKSEPFRLCCSSLALLLLQEISTDVLNEPDTCQSSFVATEITVLELGIRLSSVVVYHL